MKKIQATKFTTLSWNLKVTHDIITLTHDTRQQQQWPKCHPRFLGLRSSVLARHLLPRQPNFSKSTQHFFSAVIISLGISSKIPIYRINGKKLIYDAVSSKQRECFPCQLSSCFFHAIHQITLYTDITCSWHWQLFSKTKTIIYL